MPATLDDAIGALASVTQETTALIQAVNVRKALLDTASTSAIAAATQVAADRVQTGADRVQTGTDAAIVKIARDEAVAARDLLTLFGGISATFASKAAADAGVGTVANIAFVLVLQDETRGNRRTIYQKQSGVFVFIRDGASDAWNTFIAYPSDTSIRAAAIAAIAAGGGRVILPPGKITLTSPLPVASRLKYKGLPPETSLGVIPDNPWSFPANNKGTVLVGDGTFPCFAGNNVDQPAFTQPVSTATQQVFSNSGLQFSGIEDVGIDTFSRGLDLGAANIMGIFKGSLKHILVRNCSDWGISLTNAMHTLIDNIWVCSEKAAGLGHGFRMRVDCFGALIPGNMPVGNIYVFQGNLTKYGIRFETVAGCTENQIAGTGRMQCNRFGGESVTQAATMTSGSTNIGVTDLSKFPVGMPVTLSATANGFTADRAYFVQQASGTSGAGTIQLGYNERPLYQANGNLLGGGPIAATGSTAVNINTKGMPNLSIVGHGGDPLIPRGQGLISGSKFMHLDLEGYATIGCHVENASGIHVDIVGLNGDNLVNLAVRRALHSRFDVKPEITTDIDTASSTSIFEGTFSRFGNARGMGLHYDNIANRGALQIRGGLAGNPDFAGLYLSGGSMIQVNAALTKRVGTGVGGTVSLDAGRAGVLPISGGGTNVFTLPTITNASNWTSWIGVCFELVVLGSAAVATINTDAAQPFNNITGKTSVKVPPGGSIQLCAINNGSSFYWAILGGLDVDVIRWDAGTLDPASIPVGSIFTRTTTVPGAAVGDRVQAAITTDQQGLLLNAWVSAPDTVTLDYVNPPWNTARGAIDLPSHNLSYFIRRRV